VIADVTEHAQDDLVLPPGGGKQVWLQGLGVRFLVRGEQTGGRFALVEHPMQPKALGAPLHTHEQEDEVSYIVEGQVGVQIGEQVFVAEAGSLVRKPRGVPHAFWNAGDRPARVLEIISPGGFERYFEEVATLFAAEGPPDPDRAAALWAQYHLNMDLNSIPRLVQAHGLAAPPNDSAVSPHSRRD
jgi:quercetin dioxygenase-like cupin family protein